MTATRTILGAAVLAGERLHVIERISPSSTFAIAVGLAGRGADTAKRATHGVTQRMRRFAPPVPASVKKALDEAGRRGALTLIAGKRDASRLINEVMDDIIDDIAADRRIRALVTEQSQGMLADATHELRSTSAEADEKVETSFRRMFNLHP